MTRVLIVSTHRADRGHYARLIGLLAADDRFTVDLLWSARPDVAVVLGDRVEMLADAVRIVAEGVPLVHIHGGEHTYGSLDERWRWAMTMMADAHCVATDDAADQIAGIFDVNYGRGGDIHVTGAPGLDDITERKPLAYPHRAIIHYNPAMDEETTRREFTAIVEAFGFHTTRRLLALEQTLWIKSNGDRHSRVLGLGVELEPETYRDELAGAAVIVGNSSAGIIEAPSLGTWAVNVGERQAGRVRAGNVIDVPSGSLVGGSFSGAIRAAIEYALSQPRYSGPNPYRHPEGKACEAIRDVLLGFQNSSDNRRDRESRDSVSRAATP